VWSQGPYPEQDQWGDERPVWYVSLIEADGDYEWEMECIRCQTHEGAYSLGEKIAHDRNIEHVCECGYA
jgi:hypothetical protein